MCSHLGQWNRLHNEIYHHTCLMERCFQSSCCQKAALLVNITNYGMVNPADGYGVRQARYIRWARQHSEHNGEAKTIPWHQGMRWIHVRQTHFGHYYDTMSVWLSLEKLCHITWSREWHNLPPLDSSCHGMAPGRRWYFALFFAHKKKSCKGDSMVGVSNKLPNN
jgi:hypothetical protein